jgi:hypothetical protein
MLELKQRILAEGKEQSSNLIDQYKAGKIRLKPGCDALQSLVRDIHTHIHTYMHLTPSKLLHKIIHTYIYKYTYMHVYIHAYIILVNSYIQSIHTYISNME